MHVIFQVKLGTTGDVADGIGKLNSAYNLFRIRIGMIKSWKKNKVPQNM
jgi:hypothetical protein